MNQADKQDLRAFIAEALANHADRESFGDDESLFAGGRLDSFTMMNLVMFLERRFGIDFADGDFDPDQVDTVDAMAALIDARRNA